MFFDKLRRPPAGLLVGHGASARDGGSLHSCSVQLHFGCARAHRERMPRGRQRGMGPASGRVQRANLAVEDRHSRTDTTEVERTASIAVRSDARGQLQLLSRGGRGVRHARVTEGRRAALLGRRREQG